ncbi:hypothetical protein SAMN02910358_01555 [Lachnospiraceae bacterium XBB1006]|nr:hypothetical protein SAMN02910358_01555 [Lachnospiraceae bacterium XBB1006]
MKWNTVFIGHKIALMWGTALLLLMPLMAKVYSTWVFKVEGSAHVVTNDYITEWPLKGVLIIGVLLVIDGLVGYYNYFKSQKK